MFWCLLGKIFSLCSFFFISHFYLSVSRTAMPFRLMEFGINSKFQFQIPFGINSHIYSIDTSHSENNTYFHLLSSVLWLLVFFLLIYRFLAFLERFISGYLRVMFCYYKQKFKNSILKYIITCKVHFISFVDLV